MKELSTEDVLAAFEKIGDKYIHLRALCARLEKDGYPPEMVAMAVERAIDERRLNLDPQGGLRLGRG